MPYFTDRVYGHGRTEKVAICSHFEQALGQQRALHEVQESPRECAIRVIFADEDMYAENLLLRHRRPEDGLIGEP